MVTDLYNERIQIRNSETYMYPWTRIIWNEEEHDKWGGSVHPVLVQIYDNDC